MKTLSELLKAELLVGRRKGATQEAVTIKFNAEILREIVTKKYTPQGDAWLCELTYCWLVHNYDRIVEEIDD